MTWTLLRSFSSSNDPSLSNPDLISYIVGKVVKVTYARDGLTLTAEGRVHKAATFALLIEASRNKSMILIEAEWLVSVEEIEPKVVAPKLIVRQLGPIDAQVVRQHLADRHGFLLTSIPSDPELALGVHEDHHGFKLGHQHGNKEPRGRNVPTPEDIAERAARLDDMLVCESCGYERRPEQDGKIMHQTADLIMHCEDCKDEEEFTYV